MSDQQRQVGADQTQWPPPGHSGMLVAGVAGSITIVAFLTLPNFSVPLLGGVSMPTIISFLSRVEPGFALLWLMPVSALFVAGAGFWLWSSTVVGQSLRLRMTGYVRGQSLLLIIAYIVFFLYPSSEDESIDETVEIALSLIEFGYVLGFLGALVAFIGSCAEIRELTRNARN